jgi:hypothetical protein
MAITYGFFWPRSFPVPNLQLETVLPEVILAQKLSVTELDLMIDVIWMSSRITGGDGNELSRPCQETSRPRGQEFWNLWLSFDWDHSGSHEDSEKKSEQKIIKELVHISNKLIF